MLMRKVITILIISILAAVVVFYIGKVFILERVKIYLIEKIESSTPMGMMISDISYLPLKGISLSGVALYKDKRYKEKEFYLPELYIKFSFIQFLRTRTVSPTFILRNLKVRNVTLNGAFGFSTKLTKKIETAKDAAESLQSIWLKKLDIKSPFLDIKNISGTFDIDKNAIKSSDIRFKVNGEPCILRLEAADPFGELTSTLKASSARLNFTSRIKKEAEIYKIPEIKGDFMGSSFEFMGEFENIDAPILSLYGKAYINIGDMARFAEGKLTNSIYFKANLKELSSYELGIKSEAGYLNIRDFRFDKFYMDARVKDGIAHIPVLSARPYGGTFVSSAELDLTDSMLPYKISGRLSTVDIAELLKNTKLGSRGISGFLFSEFAIKGDAKSMASTEGRGNILVKNGNLGPAPLLTPLIGNLYGYFRGLFPKLQKIDITDGSCDFVIANRKISTDNLVIWGEMASVHAKGYIDFDKNLNFEAENRFMEPERAEGDDLESAIQTTISRFGRLMSKARLGGTLDNPKWKFEYLGGIQNVITGELEKVIKDIFE
jgi:hypothetical protein